MRLPLIGQHTARRPRHAHMHAIKVARPPNLPHSRRVLDFLRPALIMLQPSVFAPTGLWGTKQRSRVLIRRCKQPSRPP